MEPLARLTLLGMLAPRGALVFPRPGGDGSFAVWNGSSASLPVAKQDERALPRGRRRGRKPLKGEAYTAVLLGQSLVVLSLIGFLGVRIVGHRDRAHFESWNL
jgi:hypothetical protein